MSKKREYPCSIEDMDWDLDDPQFYHSKGHHDFEAFAAELLHLFGNVGIENVTPFCRHTYAMSAQTGRSRANGWAAEIIIYDSPGRGRYPITLYDCAAAAIEERALIAQAKAEREARAEANAGPAEKGGGE